MLSNNVVVCLCFGFFLLFVIQEFCTMWTGLCILYVTRLSVLLGYKKFGICSKKILEQPPTGMYYLSYFVVR